ncbi:XRE family transcriptional regulator [Lactiplantibacillus pentosus]|uniref:XRE family transcriptional regulator n=2 Tax=Lactiplantibacillus pentosus TaxID=1589 RepID=A0AB37RHF9_LACPE|nr:XRE family transcriptional regulator [Lactiplantibacillus pentosus]RMW48322.1 XRE family transcriptional regulator [Lactiplantibacillus pentosus]RMW52460.1 XRE family transcriptional regulator [Lactiplantibacillus pentosus]RMW55194.1 XRE family transcriptional regulator [Lactiplantibacillus pentosus]
MVRFARCKRPFRGGIAMLNGSIIKKRRKELKMNQLELAKGITNQPTISLLENENRPPSVGVLIQIAQKLDLDLNDIAGVPSAPTIQKSLSEAEHLVETYNYSKAKVALTKLVAEKKELNSLVQDRLDCLLAICDMWLTKDWDTAIFNFNQITIVASQHKLESVFPVLALVETGVAYFNKKDTAKQSFYFTEAAKRIVNVTPNEDNIYWYLFILNNIAKYYSKTGDFEQSTLISTEAISIGQEFSTSYFIEMFYYLIAYANESINDGDVTAEEYQKALFFAEYNKNETIIKQAKKHIAALKRN